MKYIISSLNDIEWYRNPPSQNEALRTIIDAGRFEELCELHADEDGNCDLDELYDYIRYNGENALLDVGMHYTEATATVAEVVAEWEKQNAPAKVKRDKDGKPCASIYTYNGEDLYLDATNEDGDDEDVILDNDEIVELMRDKHHGNANTGEWDCDDPDTAEFEMWRDRD